MVVADTDVLIDFLAGRSPGAAAIASLLESGALATTVINRFELLSGARTPRQLQGVTELLDALPTLELGRFAGDRAALVRRTLDSEGLTIGMADSLIAGIVLDAGARLLTRNRKHFERVEGLLLA